jgi:hypothetical protein
MVHPAYRHVVDALNREALATNLASKFADFLEDAWASLGDVPPQSFTKALRDFQQEPIRRTA